MIAVSHIAKSFDNHTVLKDVDFQVPKGGSLVILGQSGSGKSVLLKILACLLEPDQGTLQLKSKNIGMLFQKNALFDSMTVQENLEFPLKERTKLNAKERQEKSQMFLEWVGLPQAGPLFPEELSGGMQKRLGIARALIVEPDILFYDEPTAGLDPITSRLIADLILRLKKEFGTTLVVVTSDVMRAYQMADNIGILIRSTEGSYFLPAGTPQEAQVSTDPRIQQFLKGHTKGPLTTGVEEVLHAD